MNFDGLSLDKAPQLSLSKAVCANPNPTWALPPETWPWQVSIHRDGTPRPRPYFKYIVQYLSSSLDATVNEKL